MQAIDVLKEYFGYESFRNNQERVIDNILSGGDIMTIMPTGGGKSICYQVPALLMDGTTIVISPLISLMKDQVNALEQSGVACAYINSTQTSNEQAQIFQKALQGQYKMIYVAPEQLLTDRFLNLCDRISIPLISVDEAHCVSHWGQDFRPGYLDIKPFINNLNQRPVIAAFTATATPKVKDSIVQRLGLYQSLEVISGFDRPNLFYKVIQSSDKDKVGHVKAFLKDHPNEFGIIYCQTRKQVESLTETLNKQGVKTGSYHAGMPQEQRALNQELFQRDELSVMVATNAFGMGIDKSNVSFVIHYSMPKNIESYYQEAGRAGRDGSVAQCLLLYSGKDVVTANFFIDSAIQNDSMSDEEFKLFQEHERSNLRAMVAYCKTNRCLRHFVLKYFNDVSPTHCGNCHNCLTEFHTEDITVDAQKIISCVIRMEERFGTVMVCDVLRGSKKKAILDYNFDSLSTYGIMREVSMDRLRNLIDILLEEGYLKQSNDKFVVLQTTNLSRSVLVGETQIEIQIAKEVKQAPKNENMNSNNPELFERLRALRKSLADEKSVPAFVIFSDATLRDMCEKMPRDESEFLKVSGIGEHKAKLYGEDFIELLNQD